MIQIYFTGLRCDEETDEVGADEPYILVTTVDLGAVAQVAGFPVPIPGYDVFRFGPYSDVDKGDFRAGPGPSQAFWSRTGAPATLNDPDSAIFAVAVMENDAGNAETLRGIVKGLVGGSVFGSLDLDRDKKVESLLRDINSGLRTPTGAPNFDDQVGGPQELKFTRDELARAESGAQVAKSLVFTGDGGRYTATFEARNPTRDWSGLGDRWRSIGGFFPAGAPISVTSRNAGNLDLFITGNDGRVYTSWWYQGHDWSGVNNNWRNIGGVFPKGAPVTAIAKSPNSIDLFITGNDGRVYTSWWYEGNDWSGLNDRWRNIGGIFPAGRKASAIARTAQNLDVFITGNDGRVYTSWWQG